jgi:flagellar basal body P-ring formation protein FlgA
MKLPILTAALLLSSFAQAQTAPKTDAARLRQTVEQFLEVQSAGLPGKVKVTVGAIDSRTALGPCAAPEAFLMPGARAWGKTSVGVRCAAPSTWTVYIQANVSVLGNYIAAGVPLAQGQAIQESQLVTLQGDLATLPSNIVTDKSQVIGRSSNISLAAGMPLRLDNMRSKPVVQNGQLVRLVAAGAGFSISSEGKATGNASEGQVVQVRTAGGQQVSGVAKAGGLVEVAF